MNAETAPAPGRACRFAHFRFDPERGVLSAHGAEVVLRPKTYALLECFLAHPGRLMSKAELLSRVWPGVVVTDDSLVQCVGELRAALDDREQRLIKTVPRRGYLLDADVQADGPAPTRPEPPAPSPGTAGPSRAPWPRMRVAMLVAALAVLLVGAGGGAWWLHRQGGADIDRGFAAQRAIAVMPFVDLSEPPSPAFSEALLDDITSAVAQLADSVVFASASTAKLAGRTVDPREVGRVLGASHVLTGRVRRSGEEVRIWAQLHRADTGVLVWSDRFDYAGTAQWEWPRDITRRLANALDTRLRDAYVLPEGYKGRAADAIEATHQAFYLTRHARQRADLHRARALLDDALARDPDSVVALTRWGLTHVVEVALRWSTDRPGQLEQAAGAFDRALALRHNYAPAHYGRSNVLFFRGEIDEAARACEQALALAPNDVISLQRLGYYRLHQGRAAESLPLITLALRLNPLDTDLAALAHHYLGMSYFHLQRDDEAYAEMRKATAANPRHGFAWQWMAAIDALHGRAEAARMNLARFEALLPGQTVSGLRKTETSRNPAYWAQRDRFYDGLARAGLPP